MAQVPLQVAAAGAYHKTMAHETEAREFEQAIALVGSATDQDAVVVTTTSATQMLSYILTTDATAGTLTIEVAHADLFAGPFTEVTDDALVLGGENKGQPEGDLVVDMTVLANQGAIVIGVSGSGRELDVAGNLVSQLKPFHRLRWTTDAGYNGTIYDLVAVSHGHRHVPGPNAD